MASSATTVDHALRLEHHYAELNQAGFVARTPTGFATTTCSCGLTTGPDAVPLLEALGVYEEHRVVVQQGQPSRPDAR